MLSFEYLWQRKITAYWVVMSAAGVIFLSVLGFLFYIESTALFPDLYFSPKEDEIVTIKDIEANFYEQAQKCWIAAGISGISLIGALWLYNT